MSGSVETSDHAENWAIEPAPATRFWQRRWLSLLIMVVVFCSGAAIGSGLTTISIESIYQERWRRPWNGQKRMLEALNRELDLSDSQTAEVSQILKKHDEAVKKIWSEEVGPKMQTLVKQLDGRIAAVLTPEQEPLWHAWLDKRKSRVCPPPPRTSRHGRDGRPHADRNRRPPPPPQIGRRLKGPIGVGRAD
ncbi:MAG TPA: hypothetical protein VMV10_25300 [Pirellulales bacterium]|nr:hypothetical protein [Pirellulales bacterium]